MKKIYAIAGALLLAAGSMNAATNKEMLAVDPSQLGTTIEISPETQAQLSAEVAYAEYVMQNNINDGKVLGRTSWTDANGVKWDAQMYRSGQWEDNFTSWESAKYYAKVVMTLSSSNYNSSNNRSISYYCFYPKVCLWKEEYWSQLFGDNVKSGDDLFPLTSWGNEIFTTESTYFLVPQAVSDKANSFYIGMTSDGDDNHNCFVLCNTTTYSNDALTDYYYTSGSMGQCFITTNGSKVLYGPTTGSYVKLSNYNAAANSMDMEWKGGVTATNNGPAAWSYTMNYSGEMYRLLGLTEGQQRGFDVAELHMVNTGQVSFDNYSDYYDVDFGPLTRFYMLGCGKGLSWTKADWTATAIPTKVAATETGYIYNTFFGALYSAPNTENPYDIWREMEITYDTYRLTTNAPKAGSFVYGGYNSLLPWSPQDGTRVTIQSYYSWFPISATTVNPALAMCGTTDGFGFKGLDQYNTTVLLNFKGDVVYHYDATDYTKTKTIASVGELEAPAYWENQDGVNTIGGEEANTTIAVENGKVIVNMSEAGNVAVYTAAGTMVKNFKAAAGTTTLELGNGLFIVKAGKKVVKVML